MIEIRRESYFPYAFAMKSIFNFLREGASSQRWDSLKPKVEGRLRKYGLPTETEGPISIANAAAMFLSEDSQVDIHATPRRVSLRGPYPKFIWSPRVVELTQ